MVQLKHHKTHYNMKTLTEWQKRTWKKEFKELKHKADSGYLPRQNHVIAKVNELAMNLEEKPVTRGCGPCVVKDVKRILDKLWTADVEKKD